MEWNKKNTMYLIQLVKQRPIIWDAHSNENKDKTKKRDAFLEISNIMGIPIKELTTKWINLKGQYSREKRKVKTGNGASEIYVSKWFAYQEMFEMMSSHRPQNSITDLETSSFTQPENINDLEAQLIKINPNNDALHQVSIKDNTFQCPSSSLQTRGIRTTASQRPTQYLKNILRSKHSAQQKIADALRRAESLINTSRMKPNTSQTLKAMRSTQIVNNISNHQQQTRSIKSNNSTRPVEDEFYFFAMSIAAQLRNLPLNIALQMQVKIQNQLYVARTQSPADRARNFIEVSLDRDETEINPLEVDAETMTFKDESDDISEEDLDSMEEVTYLEEESLP